MRNAALHRAQVRMLPESVFYRSILVNYHVPIRFHVNLIPFIRLKTHVLHATKNAAAKTYMYGGQKRLKLYKTWAVLLRFLCEN